MAGWPESDNGCAVLIHFVKPDVVYDLWDLLREGNSALYGCYKSFLNIDKIIYREITIDVVR